MKKIKYQDVYSFEVIREISEAQSVMMLDKECDHVCALENLTVFEVFAYINKAKECPDRFTFYKRIEVDEDVQV